MRATLLLNFLCALMIAVFSKPLVAQQINFKLQGSEQILITQETRDINFNEVTETGRPFYLPGDNGATIDLTQNRDQIAIFRIEAPNHLDVNVDVTASPFSLVCSSNCSSPLPELEFQLGWAYWNRTTNNDVITLPTIDGLLPAAREVLSSTGIPLNFGSATFPMRQRSLSNAAPGAPPVPDHDGYTEVPATSAFILIYGRLGAIPDVLQAGSYETTITVTATTPTYP